MIPSILFRPEGFDCRSGQRYIHRAQGIAMTTDPLSLGRRSVRVLALLCLGLAAAGCGPGFKTVPVSGKVLVNGQPLTGAEATVLFRGDASRGNTNHLDFSGTVAESGNYT